MRQKYPNTSLGDLCALFGVTRQAYYEVMAHANSTSISNSIILTLVREIRAELPLIGARKLMHMLLPQMHEHNIKMGRDQLFSLLRFHGLLIRRRKRMIKTTDSNHWLKRYPNLIKEIVLTGPEQLWVSDITYIRTLQGFGYLSLITDAYSRKIVGYDLNPTLEAIGCINALSMAVQSRKRLKSHILIHHSDRGIQYCCSEYTEILRNEDITISMTQSGSPYDNALAERINGIIKNEFYPKKVYQNHKEARKEINKVITI